MCILFFTINLLPLCLICALFQVIRRRRRRSQIAPSAALKADVLDDHNKIISEELQKTIDEEKPKKKAPYRDPTFLSRQQARRDVRLRYKGSVSRELERRLPSPCSTCVDRRIRSTKAAVRYAARRWRPKEPVSD